MISYSRWRTLNESLYPLGLTRPSSVSPIVGQFQYLDEKKKHMDRDPEEDEEMPDDEEGDEEPDEDDEDEEGDEFEDKGSSKGCGDSKSAFCSKMMKKKMKKKMKNECDCEDKKKRPVEMDDEEDDDHDHDEEEDNDEEDEEGDEGDGDEGGMKRPLGFMKKKGMKKKMKKKMKKENTEFLNSFNSYLAPENQMTTEQEFWKSISGHFEDGPETKFSDGFSEYMEDYLIAPENDYQGEPNPGQVGHAPQQRIGWFGMAGPQENESRNYWGKPLRG